MRQKTAFITGGASGIGRAVAEMLDSRGVRVTIADLDYQGAESLASGLKHASPVQVDVKSWGSQVAAFQSALDKFEGRIDYVYAIAGIGERKWMPNDPLATGFTQPDLSVIDVDLTGLLHTVALAVQQMRRQMADETGHRGKSLAVAASVCGFYCVPTLPVYTAAKHGVVGFVRSYGKHLSAEQITLNAVCPNIVKTNISSSAFYDKAEASGMIVPMFKVVEAFENCLDGDISGEILEVEPRTGISRRAAPDFTDEEAKASFEILHERGTSLHKPETFD